MPQREPGPRRPGSRLRPRRGQRVRLALEALEVRWLPSLTFQFANSVGVLGNGSVDVESNSVVNDASGNVYVTGSLQGTADFNPGPALTNLSSTGGRDVFVAKYSPSGALVWANDLRGGNASSVAQGGAVVVDGSGNVFVTGSYTGTVNFDPRNVNPAATFTSPQGGNDVFLAEYDRSGSLLWARDVAGTTGAIDEGYALAIDGAGDVVAAGSFANTATFGSTTLTAGGLFDSFVTKLSASGQFLWAKATTGSGSSVAQANGVSVDGSGNVITTGFYAGSVDFDPGAGVARLPYVGAEDIYIQKLDPSGNLVWAESVGSPDINQGLAVAADATGNIVVTGTFALTANFNPGSGAADNLTANGFEDAFLLKLNPAGQLTWAKDLPVAQYGAARGTGVAFDGSGDVFVAGYFMTPITLDPTAPGATLSGAGGFDVFVAEYDRAGNYLAGQSAGGANFDADFGLGVNAAGQVAIAGRYSGPAGFGSITLPAQPGKSIFIAQLVASIPVGTPAPGAPVLEAGSDTGVSNGDRITNATTLIFDENSVSAPGNLVQLFRDGVLVGSRTGAGPITDPGPVPDGTHIYTAQQTASSGIVSAPSGGVSVTVDTKAPVSPTAPGLNPLDDSGLVGDGLTNVKQPRIVGSADPIATIQLLDSFGNVLTTTITAANGSYTILVPSPLLDGPALFRVREQDVAGNLSTPSAALTLVIDTTPPAAPSTPTILPDDDSGALGDGITSVKAPRFTGSAEAGSTVQLLDASNTVLGTTTATANGTYTVATSSPYTDGTYVVHVQAVDAARNISPASGGFTLTILTPSVAAPSTPALLPADDSGTPGDGITSINQPRLTGTAAPSTTIQLLNSSNTVIGTTTSNASGSYTVSPSTALADGTYLLHAQSVDGSGNAGPVSGTVNLTIQTALPATPASPVLLPADDSGIKGDGITNVRQPRITGTADGNALIQLLDSFGNVLSSTTTSATGSYTLTVPSLLSDGPAPFRVREQDVAGNLSTPSAGMSLIIDTTPPAVPTTPTLTPSDDSGVVGDGITNVNQPRLVGSAPSGTTVQLVNAGGSVLATSVATSNGSYTLTPSQALSDGVFTFAVRSLDAAGNLSAPSGTLGLTIATTPPAAPAAPSLSVADDTGPVGDGRTAVRRPRLVGSVAAGSAVDLLDFRGNVLASATVGAGGAYSLQPASGWSTGTIALQVRVRDVAGNVGLAGPAFNLTIVDATPGDFDGDGKTDIAVYRPAAALWIGVNSSGGSFVTPFGDPARGDLAVPADYDGIGRSELAVYRPSTGMWIIAGASGTRTVFFGDPANHDIPVPGDYDGVGHAELAVFRPATAQWLIASPTGLRVVQFGEHNLTDIPIPGDYDGVGHTEFALFRAATAQWLIASPSGLRIVQFGEYNLADIPAPGDYDGRGRTELALFRPASATWIINGPGSLRIFSFGEHNLVDIPLEAPIGSLKRLGTVGGIHLSSVTVAVPAAATAGSGSITTPTRATARPAQAVIPVARTLPKSHVDAAIASLVGEGVTNRRLPGSILAEDGGQV